MKEFHPTRKWEVMATKRPSSDGTCQMAAWWRRHGGCDGAGGGLAVVAVVTVLVAVTVLAAVAAVATVAALTVMALPQPLAHRARDFVGLEPEIGRELNEVSQFGGEGPGE